MLEISFIDISKLYLHGNFLKGSFDAFLKIIILCI